MKISKSHKRFSERLSNRRVLSNPEEFLGPNYKAVLNFWLRLDDLTVGQWETIYSCYSDLHYSEWDKATDEAWDASIETIGLGFANEAACAAEVVYCFTKQYSACWATRELIGMHKILNQNNSLTFFQMFLKVL